MKYLKSFFTSILFVPVLELVCAIAGAEVMAFASTIGWVMGMVGFHLINPDTRRTFLLRWVAINQMLKHQRAFLVVVTNYNESNISFTDVTANAHWINFPKKIRGDWINAIYSEAEFKDGLDKEINNLTGGTK